jgi:sugar phosphate isomerase/epimerase
MIGCGGPNVKGAEPMSLAIPMSRRAFFQSGAAGAFGVALSVQAQQPPAPTTVAPTQFQIACMTLPYSAFPLDRALTGLQSAGYRYVAWGTTHRETGNQNVPVMAADAPPERARELAQRCRDRGLEPVMMFTGIYPEAANHLDVMRSRIRQASAAGIPHLLTFGNTNPTASNRPRWIEHFRQLGPIAREANVLIVIKPHGGLTARGAMTADIVREIGDDNVKANYDAGNVMDYLHVSAADVLVDAQRSAASIRSFCIKDHRQYPRQEDCGPGLGDIDHYRLLEPFAFTGRPMPLCCENISAPLVPRPTQPEGVDALARRAREYLELVIRGVQTVRP